MSVIENLGFFESIDDTKFSVSHLPLEAEQLTSQLKKFLSTPFAIPGLMRKRGTTLGQVKWGVYAFFDYDEEPIYVGQTKESLSTRIRRHLTGHRSDAVAKNILDPFEVCRVRVYPLLDFQNISGKDSKACEHLNALEYAVFHDLRQKARFQAVLNEKMPPTPKVPVSIPNYLEAEIATGAIKDLRGHVDIRIARRAQTLARLAAGISERKVGIGIRRTLLTQVQRLEWLAEKRIAGAPVESEDDCGPEDE